MPDVPISRRFFHIAVGSLAVCVASKIGRHFVTQEGMDESVNGHATVLKLQNFSHNPIEIADTFDKASTGLLLATYGNFFPGFMASQRFWGAPKQLENAAKSVLKPKHPLRLEALPAAAAAQALPFTKEARQE